MLIIWILLFSISPAIADTVMLQLGDGRIDGRKLRPYALSWQQCGIVEGQWQAASPLAEELTIVDEHTFRLRQTSRQPGGTVVTSDTFMDRTTLAPLRMEMVATVDGNRVASAERQLTRDGYTGVQIRGDETKKLAGKISSTMLHGGAMGLPLATMDWQSDIVEFQASMMSFDATYKVKARWVGKETLTIDDQKILAWLIDVEWLHEETGDVYPPGPDASGGRYWVVPNPPDGIPNVPIYKTDSYVVEFGHDVCPVATE